MYSLLLSNSGSTWLTVAFIIVAVLIIIVSIAAFISRLVVLAKYNKFNNVESSTGHTGFSAARNLLDANGLSDVEVKPLTFFKAMFYGNHYNAKTNTIYLRQGVINSKSITAVGLAIQKVGHAIQDKEDSPLFKFRSKVAPFVVFAPMLFIPITIIGIILDFLFSLGGVAAIISVILGVVLYLLAFTFTLFTIPVESRANKLAVELIEKAKILDTNEIYAVKDLYSSYIVAYVMEFLASLLQLFKTFLQILIKISR